jgi:hypothetical protein
MKITLQRVVAIKCRLLKGSRNGDDVMEAHGRGDVAAKGVFARVVMVGGYR